MCGCHIADAQQSKILRTCKQDTHMLVQKLIAAANYVEVPKCLAYSPV
jgi:hypothetical protein